MKRNKLLLTALAVILAMGVMVAPALAYFTAHTEAAGGVSMELGSTTEIKEVVKDWGKEIHIHNYGPESCYVRVQIFSSDKLDVKPSGDNWIDGGDNWWYYKEAIGEGDDTEILNIKITKKESEIVDGQIADVAVVYESVRVVYDEDGNVDPEDPTDASIWTTKGNPPYEGSGN